uniref:LOB domain-containing protein n=1 Tax=Kalanchoe fedtschenkoi TaxID=63787 RepID=A0A7N1A3N0_KALFE
MQLPRAPAFGNATGISPHLPKKMNPPTTTNTIPRIKNNTTTQACAACKYQRRKCEPNCILSPYFPHNRQAQFLNAHKLFGVSNITKIIRNLSPADKDQAMKTIIFQSDVRANDPVGGCYRIIRELQFMIEYYQAELDLVLHQLSICRAQQAQAQPQAHNKDNQQEQDDQQQQQQQYLPFMTSDQAANNNCSDPSSDVINADPLNAYSPSSLQYSYHHQQQQQLHLQLGGNNSNRGEEDNFVLVQDNDHRYNNIQANADVWAVQHEEQQEQMVNYCLNNNVEEDQNNSKDSFDQKKDLADNMPCFERSTDKHKFNIEEDHADGESSHEEAVLNGSKTLCRVEESDSVQNQGYEDEESADAWFALTNCKRIKTA